MKNNISVVIVDDHPLQLMLLKRELSQIGVEDVREYNCVESALNWVKTNNTDVIFCDLQMPEKDGVNMMIALNKLSYKGDVILMSALELSVLYAVKAMTETFSFRIIGEIQKPCDKEKISELLLSVHTTNGSDFKYHQEKIVTEEELLVGLANGQVKNYYQPLVDFRTNEIIGVEVLARWLHPIYGLLLPGVFLPIIERCQLSNELFDTVFTNVFRDIKSGILPYRISINVDHFNLDNPNFGENFISTCQKHNIPTDRFTIEITERDSYRNSLALFKNLTQLRIHGVSVSIDDFGTGHSSLEKLSALPFNEIKIDRSFVNGATRDSKKKHIVSFISDLAKNLDINVVAEGIEDKETWDFLKSYNIDICQGFYISKPLPLEALAIIR